MYRRMTLRSLMVSTWRLWMSKVFNHLFESFSSLLTKIQIWEEFFFCLWRRGWRWPPLSMTFLVVMFSGLFNSCQAKFPTIFEVNHREFESSLIFVSGQPVRGIWQIVSLLQNDTVFHRKITGRKLQVKTTVCHFASIIFLVVEAEAPYVPVLQNNFFNFFIVYMA